MHQLSSRGFTLLELLLSLAVISFIILLGVSSSSEWIKQNQSQLLRDELKAALHYAKLQAIIQQRTLTLEALYDDHNWAKGMVLKSAQQIVHQWKWDYPNWHLCWKGIHGEQTLQFSNYPHQAMDNGRFIMLDSKGKRVWSLVVNRIGRF